MTELKTDPFQLPAAASRATAPREHRPAAAASGPAPVVVLADRGGVTADPRAVLLRLVPQQAALAAVGATDEDYRRWVDEGRGWPVLVNADGVPLADAADVLATLALGGAA